MVSKVKNGEISQEQLAAHASTFMYVRHLSGPHYSNMNPQMLICCSIAGGETTADALSTAVYYLSKTPAALQALKSEVRNSFKSYDKITTASAAQLPYIQAVINEALRIHPPGSQGFPRISPGVTIDGHYVPAGVRRLVKLRVHSEV